MTLRIKGRKRLFEVLYDRRLVIKYPIELASSTDSLEALEDMIGCMNWLDYLQML
jgi:hypothetical protein